MSADIRARIETAVETNAPMLLAYLARRVRSSEDAADLLADTLLVLWRRAAALPVRDEEVRPWMFGIARKVLLRHIRGTTRRAALADRLRGELERTPHPGLADPADRIDLHRALAELQAIDRDIILLHHWDGLTLVEIGRTLRMKDGTVRSRYHRARSALRDALASETEPQAQAAR